MGSVRPITSSFSSPLDQTRVGPGANAFNAAVSSGAGSPPTSDQFQRTTSDVVRAGGPAVPPSDVSATNGGGNLGQLLNQLIPMLQQLLTQLQAGSSTGSTSAASPGMAPTNAGAGSSPVPETAPSQQPAMRPAPADAPGPQSPTGTTSQSAPATAPSGADPAGGGDLGTMIQSLISLLQQLLTQLQSKTAGGASAGAAPAGAGSTTPGPVTTSGGNGQNTITIKNTSSQEENIGEFLNGGSTTKPVAEIHLKPGETGTLSYANGQGGFMARSDSTGQYQSTASRLEFYADASGKNNPDISYIDGRNASISLSDGQGKTTGDTKSIAASAPAGAMVKDAAGNPTIAGWYDGSSKTMQDGGAFMESMLGTGNAYIHPHDDEKRGQGVNPMTLAGDTSQKFTATFGDA